MSGPGGQNHPAWYRQPYRHNERSHRYTNPGDTPSMPQNVPRSMNVPTASASVSPQYSAYSSPPQTHAAVPTPNQGTGLGGSVGPSQQHVTPWRQTSTGQPVRSRTTDSVGVREVLWVLDRVASYRLTRSVIHNWLSGRFPLKDYGSNDFRVEAMGDMFVFRVPRKLTPYEKEVEIRALKWNESDDDDDN